MSEVLWKAYRSGCILSISVSLLICLSLAFMSNTYLSKPSYVCRQSGTYLYDSKKKLDNFCKSCMNRNCMYTPEDCKMLKGYINSDITGYYLPLIGGLIFGLCYLGIGIVRLVRGHKIQISQEENLESREMNIREALSNNLLNQISGMCFLLLASTSTIPIWTHMTYEGCYAITCTPMRSIQIFLFRYALPALLLSLLLLILTRSLFSHTYICYLTPPDYMYPPIRSISKYIGILGLSFGVFWALSLVLGMLFSFTPLAISAILAFIGEVFSMGSMWIQWVANRSTFLTQGDQDIQMHNEITEMKDTQIH